VVPKRLDLVVFGSRVRLADTLVMALAEMAERTVWKTN
jgi:hypothetical protein